MSIVDKLQTGQVPPSTLLMAMLRKVTDGIETKKGVSTTQALDLLRIAFNRKHPDTPISEGAIYAWYTARRKKPTMDTGIRFLLFLDKF